MLEIKVKSVSYYECIPEWSWETQQNPLIDYDLWYISKGKGYLNTPHGSFKLCPGQCFILRPGEGYLANHDPKDPLIVYAVHFDSNKRNQVFPFSHLIEDTLFFEKLCKKLLESEESIREIWMCSILNEYTESFKRKVYIPTLNEERTIQLKNYIKKHLHKTISLDMLAKIVFLSRNQTTRIFKIVTGETIQSYILKERISYAENLLLHSNLPIKRIAQLCGYGEQNFFSHHFKRETGTTPGLYRSTGGKGK
jgi:AraC-like DNA-binding protein